MSYRDPDSGLEFASYDDYERERGRSMTEDLTYGGDEPDPDAIREDVEIGPDVDVPEDVEERLARDRDEDDDEEELDG